MVDRGKLWSHLSHIHMPPYLLRMMKGLYDGDSYIVVDGHKVSDPVRPSRGVKQGCPLSPLLFSLYINDVEDVFTRQNSTGRLKGAVTGTTGYRVSHLLYADDLALITNSKKELQEMLDVLSGYADRKGLTVNTGKSHVVIFNSDTSRMATVPVFVYKRVVLEVKQEFKYLGITFRSDGSMVYAADKISKALLGSIQGVQRLAREHNVHHRPNVLAWLFQTYGFGAGMYGCQVWGTGFLKQDKVFDSSVEAVRLCFLKRVLGVKRTTPNWMVLREFWLKPYQQYWFKAVACFWNDIIKSNSFVLKSVVEADRQLARRRASCWCSDVIEAAADLESSESITAALLDGKSIDISSLCEDLRERRDRVWDEVVDGDPRDEHTPHRKLCTFYHWFAKEEVIEYDSRGRMKIMHPLPKYLCGRVAPFIRKDTARLRMSSHKFLVETGRYNGVPYKERKCRLCESGEVEDELHVVLECRATHEFRQMFIELDDSITDLRTLETKLSANRYSKLIFACINWFEERTEALQAERPPPQAGRLM